MVRNSLLPALAVLSVALLIAGCSGGGSTGGSTTTTPPPTSPATQHGTVMGGTIPVIGATVQLYAVGTIGDGSAATPLLNPAVISDSTGSFIMQGSEVCPSSSALVYLVATGGNPGLASGTNNKALSMMAAIGPCSNLTPSASFVINELTTVAAVFALEPYFSSPTTIGSSPANAAALTSAFTLAAAFANPASGVTPGASVPAGATVPTERINTLADILATCIDTTGGASGDSTPCGDLLALTTPSGATAPLNTLTALLNIARNPTLNVTALFRLASDSGPFQPIPDQAPLDWTVRLQLPSPSMLKITPLTGLSFAATPVSNTAPTQAITLINTGTSAITLSGLALSGPDAADFAQTSNCPATLQPQVTCTATVSFTPTAAGSRVAYLVITSNAPNSPLPILLMGTATASAPALSLSPTSLNFASEIVGTTSSPQTIILTNSGNAQLSLTGISLTGTHAADYSLANGCAPTLAVAAHCTITITFNPTAIGTRAAAVSIVSNAATLPNTIPLTGGATPPSTPQPAHVLVGTTPVDGANVQLYAVGSTTGSAAIPLLPSALVTDSLGGFTLAGYTCPSSQALVYLVATGGNPGLSANNFDLSLMTALGPCGSLSATTPMVVNELTTVAAVAALAPYMISATAISSGASDRTALANAFTLAAQFVDPSTGTAPGTGVPSGYTVPVATINTLGDILSICTASTGGVAGDGSACGTLLSLLTLSDTPAPVGPLAAMLNLAKNPTQSTAGLFALATDTQPFQPILTTAPADFSLHLLPPGVLKISPTSLNFASILAGQTSAAQILTVANNTVAPIHFTPSLTGTNAEDFFDNAISTLPSSPYPACTSPLAPGAICTYRISFAPTAAGTRSAAFVLTDDSSTASISVPLTAIAVAAIPSVSLSPALLNFAAQALGSASMPQTVTLTNSGNAPLRLTDIFLAGTDAADYTLANACDTTLAAAAHCTFAITFNPNATGTRTAAVTIISNASTPPSPLPITGTGVSGPILPPSTSVHVYAGRTPVSGAKVQLYTVGTMGDASAATPLLSPPLVTDTTGSVALGGYACPSPQTLLYLIATGGNPGLSANNPDLAMMTAIGSCDSVTSAPLVVNELTTVAAVSALVPYMASATAVGSGTADIAALTNAFTLATQFVDPSTGTAPGTGVPPGETVPVATINTLGDILNACIASTGGTAGDDSPCGVLFAMTTPPGNATPTDSLAASLAIAGSPTFNTYSLYSLTNATQPFQPNLTSLPGDFGVRLLAAGLTASTTSINFGSVPFPANPIPLNSQTVVLTNNTAAPIALGTSVITGDTTHFGVTSGNLYSFSGQSNVCSRAIPAGGSCALVVSFIPDSSANFAATLTVPNSSSTPSLSIALAGQGVPATATGLLASPTLLNFSSAGTPQSVTLTNSGGTTIRLDNISLVELSTDIFGNVSPLTPLPLSSSPFSQRNNCGASLAPAASCVVLIGTVSNPALSGNILNSQPLPDIAYLNLVVNNETVVQPVKVQYDPSQVLNFGSWSVGIQSSPILMNGQPPPVSGETPISFTATISGPNASDFSFSPTSIVSQTSCTGPQAGICETNANIYFNATATGARSATVSYSAGGSGITTSGSYSLSGVGLSSGPHFIVEAPLRGSWIPLTNTSPYFLDTSLDSSSQPVALIVANSGTEPLSFATPTITGPNASDFSVNSTCSTLAAGGSTQTAPTCTLTLTATPTATGGRSAQLILKDTTSGTQQTIPLYVYSAYPPPTPSVYGLNFPSTMAGTTSAPQIFTITYHQGDPITLTMNASSPSVAFQIPSGFTCTSSPCTVPVTFSPSAVNTSYFGTLSITDKLSGTTSITLSGHSPPPPPLLSFSPASLTFSSLVGTASAPQTVTVTNIARGGQTVDLTSISLSGLTSGYSLTNNCPATLAPTATCTFSVTFNAPAVGTYNDGVTIVSNSPSSPDTVPLTGAGTISQAVPTVNPFLLRFPPAPLTEVRPTQTFTITNSALHPLTIVAGNGCGEACANFALSSNTCSTATCIITVSYAPKTATDLSDSASFNITDSLNGKGTNILLYGYPGLANLTFTPTTLSFPSQTVGTKSTTASFIVSNTGDGYGSISVGTLSGPDFVYSGPSQVQIAPNSTQTLPYAFVPIAAGDRSATVQITNILATPTIPLTTLTLTGTGTTP